MKRSLGVVTMVVAAVVLVTGIVIGLMPVKASITQLQPELRLLSVSCGNGYLQIPPPVVQGNLVQLPDEPGVYLTKDTFSQQCSSAVGWRKYAAWGLTAIGVLGLAIALSSANSRSGSQPSAKPAKRADRRHGGKTKRDAADHESAEVADYDSSDQDAEDQSYEEGVSEHSDVDAADDGPPASAGLGRGGAHRRRDA